MCLLSESTSLTIENLTLKNNFQYSCAKSSYGSGKIVDRKNKNGHFVSVRARVRKKKLW